MMIKTFESFAKEITFEEAYRYIEIFVNDTLRVHNNDYYRNIPRSLPDEIFDSSLIKPINQVNVNDNIKREVINSYKNIIKTPLFEGLPDIIELDEYLLPLSDITKLNITLDLGNRVFKYCISLIPTDDIIDGYIKNTDSFEEIVHETITTYNRLKDVYKDVKLSLESTEICIVIEY